MDERKNNASVERRIKDRLKSDRARIQLGRISGFGLLEMSRQRLRPGMLEATTQSCPSCHGTGLIRSDDNLALSILRQIEEEGVRKRSQEVVVKCPVSVANFIMNQKRDYVASIERNYLLSVRVEGDINLVSPEYSIEKLKSATRILSEEEPALVTADGLMEASELDGTNEDLRDEEEKPKKNRRRRRRKKKYSANEEDEKSNQEETEELNALVDNTTENSSANKKNKASQKSEYKKNTHVRKKSKKAGNTEVSTSNSTQEVANAENIELSEVKAATKIIPAQAMEENNAKNNLNHSSEQKGRSSKKSEKNEVLSSNDVGDDESSKEKRRGWWSLKD